MATIKELARLDREIAVAEHRALQNLANHLREAAIELPIQSRLALTFAQHAQEFEQRRITAYSALRGLAWDIRKDLDGNEG
jgi:hypothetical protein